MYSQELCDDTKVSFFQVLQSWELLVEILGQVQHFLWHIQDFIFAHLADLDESCDHLRIDEVFFI